MVDGTLRLSYEPSTIIYDLNYTSLAKNGYL
ncbi:hypothetical protein ABIC45_004585 [Mucilaginibacter rubeus]